MKSTDISCFHGVKALARIFTCRAPQIFRPDQIQGGTPKINENKDPNEYDMH